MRRAIVLIIAGVVAASALTVIGRAIDSDEPQGLASAQVEDIKAGGWRAALAPHSTIPVPPESGAQEVAAQHCYVNVGAQFEDHGLCVTG